MAFSRVKVAGWAYGEIFTSAQANQLDIDHANAIDGAAGGHYTLTGPLVIDGDTVEIDTLGVSGAGGLTVSGGDFYVSHSAQVGNDIFVDTFTVVAETEMQGGASVALGLTVGASLNVAGIASFQDSVILEDALSFSGSGRILGQFQVLPDSDATVNVTQVREISVAATSGHQTTITGSVGNDDWFIFSNGSLFTQTLAGLVVASIPTKTGVKYARLSGSWLAVRQWVIP